MQIVLIIIGVLILLLLIYIGFFKKSDIPEIKQDETGLKLILQQLNEVSRTVDDREYLIF
jgi:competence protein ComGC